MYEEAATVAVGKGAWKSMTYFIVVLWHVAPTDAEEKRICMRVMQGNQLLTWSGGKISQGSETVPETQRGLSQRRRALSLVASMQSAVKASMW